MDEIKRVRVLLLGQGDYPLADVTVHDQQVLGALQRLIEQEAVRKPVRLVSAPETMTRAVVRSGVATLQRVLGKGLMKVLDDGRLQAKGKDPAGLRVADEQANTILR